MSWTDSVVYLTTDTFRLLSYGHGAAYEIQRPGSGGESVWVQGDDASELGNQIEAVMDIELTDDQRDSAYSMLLGEYWTDLGGH